MPCRFRVSRFIRCPVLDQARATILCRLEKLEECRGCGILADDRETYGDRTFFIVESRSVPSPALEDPMVYDEERGKWVQYRFPTKAPSKAHKYKPRATYPEPQIFKVEKTEVEERGPVSADLGAVLTKVYNDYTKGVNHEESSKEKQARRKAKANRKTRR